MRDQGHSLGSEAPQHCKGAHFSKHHYGRSDVRGAFSSAWFFVCGPVSVRLVFHWEGLVTRPSHLSCVLFVSSMRPFPRTGVFQGRGGHDRDVQRSMSDLLLHAARHATVCGGKLTLPSMSNSKPWTEVDVQLDQWTMWFETNPSPDSRPLTTLDRCPSPPRDGSDPRRVTTRIPDISTEHVGSSKQERNGTRGGDPSGLSRPYPRLGRSRTVRSEMRGERGLRSDHSHHTTKTTGAS